MRLSDFEQDCLILNNAGFLAQKRLARGLRLNYPECVAILSCQMLEFAREGYSVEKVIEISQRMLGKKFVQTGVDKMLKKITIQASFVEDGLKIITVENPISNDYGDLEMLYFGSFLPIPNIDLFKKQFPDDFVIIDQKNNMNEESVSNKNAYDDNVYPGQIIPFKNSKIEVKANLNKDLKNEEGELDEDNENDSEMKASDSDEKQNKLEEFIELNKEKNSSDCIILTVTNLSDQKITIGSHFNFIEANKFLQFDRSASFGMRLNIPSGEVLTFEPKSTKNVPLIRISGLNIVKGGNNLVDGTINEETLKKTMKKITKKGFSNKAQEKLSADDIKLVNLEFNINMPETASIRMERVLYINKYGPTVGDKIRLGDTDLIAEIEKDFTIYGEELTCGIGKSIREGMSQAVSIRNDTALDTIITNIVLIDAMCGIIKADIGIKDGMIHGVGKGGNPHTMQITPGMVIGAGTDVICGEGLIVTTGAIDIGACFSQSKQSLMSALSSGVTTIFGGGSGSSESSFANCTPGPNHIKYMIQSTDELAINFGFYAKANSSSTKSSTDSSAFDFSKELEDQLIAGAIGLRLSECWGSTPASIDSCLRLADFYDVSVFLDTDSLNESFEDDLQSILKNRVAAIPLNSERFNHSYLNEILTQSNLIAISSLNKMESKESKLEDYLHDLGVLSVITSSSFNSSETKQYTSTNLITKTWQLASRMNKKTKHHENDNQQIKRYLAKYTINPALLTGCSHAIGSIEPNKMADMVIWRPEFFGTKAELIIKGGQIVWSSSSLSNCSINSNKNSQLFGSCGKSPCANSVLFISKASFEVGATNTYGICKHVEPLRDCRNLNRLQHMQPLNYSPKVIYASNTTKSVLNFISPSTNEIKQLIPIDLDEYFKNSNNKLENLPLNQRYFLF